MLWKRSAPPFVAAVAGMLAMPATPLLAANMTSDAGAERLHLTNRDVIRWMQNGTLTVTEATTVDMLLVGGGGGGGRGKTADIKQGGGGGGAGGVIYLTSQTLQPGTYTISVGDGGAVGAAGGDTTAFDLTAYGGGAGANSGGHDGGNGASGGGATASSSLSFYGGDAQHSGQGYDGGGAGHIYGAGGGGGASASGETVSGSTPGKGGDGVQYSIIGTNVWYAGGGAGFRGNAANLSTINGGKGGGGSCVKYDSANFSAEPGEDGLGGGGCGGAAGGSGVVILSFARPDGGADSDDFLLSGSDQRLLHYGDTVLVFTNSGTLTVTGSGYADILAVGGGGGGGAIGANNRSCAGGGAGGVVFMTNIFVSAGTYSIAVGQGGGVGENGGLTSALGVLAFGGGAGADEGGHAGADGASGGGATSPYQDTVQGGSAIYSAYGNSGNPGGASSNMYGAGGGGGAGTAGDPTTNDSYSGAGGDGIICNITGKNVCYGGGGGGYRGQNGTAGAGGAGGGGAGNEPGIDGLGGGGGGNAVGGSGFVAIRFRKRLYMDEIPDAVGGTMTKRDGYRIHTFSQDGTFTLPDNALVDILLVGGGGGGGECNSSQAQQGGGGGGAGGFLYATNIVLEAGAHSITVGNGGVVGEAGGNTAAFGFIAYGGGAGAKYDGNDGGNGASGGGATAKQKNDTMVPYAGGSALYSSEDNCGNAGGRAGHIYGAGGGGGAGEAGETASGSTPGRGGDGLVCAITGADVWYAGGGAGFRGSAAALSTIPGGNGGGGSCVKYDSTNFRSEPGEDGLGGGGCGGAAGGSGVVIVRYKAKPKGTCVIFK